MPDIVPCLWFDGDAEAAGELYAGLFPDAEVRVSGRYGPDGAFPEGTAMTVSATLDGVRFLLLNGGPQYRFSEATSFQILCADQAEVDHYWDGLTADGGEEGRCGWLKDRFGASWQVVPHELPSLLGDPDPERAGRATQAMFGMGRLDIAAMRAAADGA